MRAAHRTGTSLIIAVALVIAGLAGFSRDANSAPLEVRVGVEQDFKPYAFVDDKGRPAGFAVDLIQAVADVMGMQLRIFPGTWDSVWNGLIAGELDALPVVAKLPSRAPLVAFGLPHTETFDAFFTRGEAPPIEGIKGAEGKEIVVLRSDAAHHALLERNFQGRIIPVDTISEMLSLITSGKHDALLYPKLLGALYIKDRGITGLSAGPPIPDYKRVFSFAVKKGEGELLEKLNEGLLIVKTSGEYDRIYEKWLHIDDPWHKYEKYLVPAIAAVAAVALLAGLWVFMLQRQVRKRTLELAKSNEKLRLATKELDKRIDQRTAELTESEKRYRSYIEVTGQIGWTTDADGMVSVDLPSWRNYTGQTFDGIKGWGWSNALHPDDLAHTQERWKRAVAERSGYETEYRIRRHDGVYRHFMARGIPVFREDGSIQEWVGACIDITERKGMEDELRKNREDLTHAQSVGSIGSWRLDIRKNQLTWSDENHRIFGIPKGTVLTYEIFLSTVHPDDRAYVDAEWKAGLAGKPYDIEHRIVVDGKTKWVREKACLEFSKGGKLLGGFGIAQDITGKKMDMETLRQAHDEMEERVRERTMELQKMNEALQAEIVERRRVDEEKKQIETQMLRAQRMESIGTLAAGIAHDLNNVLTPILMSVQLLEAKCGDEKSKRILTTLGKSARRGADLIGQVMSFARGVKGERVLIRIERIMAEIEKVISETFPRNIKIDSYASRDLFATTGDATQLHQVLMNLCVNARDAMPDGGSIDISAENAFIDENYARVNIEAKVGSYVAITVSDTGTGIPSGIKDRIFEPFYTTKEFGKGTGLGLSTVVGIVKSHGGFINVYSEPGQGSAFTVYLPAVETEERQKTQGERLESPAGRGELILIVDDEPQILEVARATLETSGYRVFTANDGVEAVELYGQYMEEIEVVLMDMMMPNMDGQTAISALRSMNPKVRIVGASGLMESDKLMSGVHANMRAFLKKPYSAEALLNAIGKVLEDKA